MIHIGGYPNKYAPRVKQILKEEKPQIFISGHSHILKVMYDKELKFCISILVLLENMVGIK